MAAGKLKPVEGVAREGGQLARPERLNTLVDAVYAIIMTLLVLELKLPEGLSPAEAARHLSELGPKVVAFLIGFTVAASGWAFVHQVNALFARSNLLHLAINLAALMVASLIPFSASVMGAFPDASYGPELYALNVGVLTALYGVDLLVGGRGLIPPVVDRRFLRFLTTLVFMAAGWCFVVALVVAPRNPRLALLALGVHFVTHWACHFATERALRRETTQVAQWAGEAAANETRQAA